MNIIWNDFNFRYWQYCNLKLEMSILECIKKLDTFLFNLVIMLTAVVLKQVSSDQILPNSQFPQTFLFFFDRELVYNI